MKTKDKGKICRAIREKKDTLPPKEEQFNRNISSNHGKQKKANPILKHHFIVYTQQRELKNEEVVLIFWKKQMGEFVNCRIKIKDNFKIPDNSNSYVRSGGAVNRFYISQYLVLSRGREKFSFAKYFGKLIMHTVIFMVMTMRIESECKTYQIEVVKRAVKFLENQKKNEETK